MNESALKMKPKYFCRPLVAGKSKRLSGLRIWFDTIKSVALPKYIYIYFLPLFVFINNLILFEILKTKWIWSGKECGLLAILYLRLPSAFPKYNNVKRCNSIDILRKSTVRVMTEHFGFSFKNQVKLQRHQQSKYSLLTGIDIQNTLNKNVEVNILYTFFMTAGLEWSHISPM